MKALIDTNVLLSAALRDGLPERVVMFIAENDEWEWLVTPDIQSEYSNVLRRPKFGLSEEALTTWDDLLRLRTIDVGRPPPIPEFAPDPKDTPFLAAALATNADYLITGDRAVLDAKDAIATCIVTVAEFAARFAIT